MSGIGGPMRPTSSVRFVQTGDWHLGQAYRNVDPGLAERLREARLDAVDRALAEAGRLGAAFLIAAGDQFDGPLPEPRLVRALFDRIDAHRPLPVHMIPGNHDPCMPGSVYDRSDFRARPSNLHFHQASRPVALADLGATLYPCPCADRFGENPMAWIPPRAAGDGWRIGLAHGSLPTIPAEPGERNYPIPADAPTRYDLDYVALGDWHTSRPDPRERPDGRMYYAGAPEVGGWDETEAGSVLAVDLTPDAAPRVTAHRVRGHDWRELRPELHTSDDLERLGEQLARLASPTCLVRVCPRGALALEDRRNLEALIEGRKADFASLSLDGRDLRLACDRDADLPRDPLIQAAYRRLVRLAADPADGLPLDWPRDLPTPDAEVTRRALFRFRDLLPGGTQADRPGGGA